MGVACDVRGISIVEPDPRVQEASLAQVGKQRIGVVRFARVGVGTASCRTLLDAEYIDDLGKEPALETPRRFGRDRAAIRRCFWWCREVRLERFETCEFLTKGCPQGLPNPR